MKYIILIATMLVLSGCLINTNKDASNKQFMKFGTGKDLKPEYKYEDINAVPEPMSLVLFGGGMAWMLNKKRKKKGG